MNTKVREIRLRVVTLLTDFGLRDAYVAQMKAVILSICPEAQIVDITHQVERFNISMGALILAQSAPLFPEGTVHVAVVDPGVGTGRRPIVVATRRSLLVGPDNGLLAVAAEREGVEHVYHITNKRVMRAEVSSTFHGRDVFAPAAAHLARGLRPEEVGEEVKDYVRLSFEPAHVAGGVATLRILYVDSFGNAVTNLGYEAFSSFGVRFGEELVVDWRRGRVRALYSPAYFPEGRILLVRGSQGLMELSLGRGSLADRLGAGAGDVLTIRRAESCR
ncbi:MAG: S-adenosyl-l-methionine hydroxide adenosyltransferase family protein [Candidatus Bathyarchaeia archaeon]